MFIPAVAGATAAALLAAAAPAAAPLTASSVRIGEHPGFTRVVVGFRGGPIGFEDVQMGDRSDLLRAGRARFDLGPSSTKTATRGASGGSLRARLTARSGGGARLSVTAAARRYKAVSERVLHNPERLVLDFWAAAPPAGQAVVRNDGCLALDSFSVTRGRIRARGRALEPLFENGLVLEVRRADGRSAGLEPLIAARGRWSGTVRYRAAPPGPATFEATVYSAKDGSLECLVQVPVRLP